MAQTAVDGVEGVRNVVGQHLGFSEWLSVTQELVDRFADATQDHQWIHVDAERAKRESPFGGPIAHGYLLLSLVPMFSQQILELRGLRMGVNYGTERVRFTSAVPVGSRIRAGAVVDSMSEVEGGVHLHVTFTIEVAGKSKPAMVATVVQRRYF